jgi:hypothetical protein
MALNRPDPGVVANNISTSQFTATATAAAIASSRDLRMRLFFKNTHASLPVYIGGDNTVSASTGFSIAAGVVQEVRTTASVFIVTGGGSITVEVFEEFVTTDS